MVSEDPKCYVYLSNRRRCGDANVIGGGVATQTQKQTSTSEVSGNVKASQQQMPTNDMSGHLKVSGDVIGGVIGGVVGIIVLCCLLAVYVKRPQRQQNESSYLPEENSRRTQTRGIEQDTAEQRPMCVSNLLALVPCGHRCVCALDGGAVVGRPCPLCRTTATQAIRVFDCHSDR